MPINKLPFVYPQLVLIAGILAILLFGLFKAKTERMRGIISIVGVIFLAVAAIVCIKSPFYGSLSDLLQFDSFSKFFLLFVLFASGVSMLAASQSTEISPRRFPEFTALLFTIGIGISFMAAAQDLLLAYLAMETVSLSSYILTGFKRTHQASHEASLKYAIFGGVASGVMVFGMSLLYGMTGTTSFSGIAQELMNLNSSVLATNQTGVLAIIVSLIMVFTGFFFKIAAVPFHQWCPDVYQGAPTPFTGFLSVAPKAAGFALILRFLAQLLPQVDVSIQQLLIPIIGLISAITMTLGNFTALHQTNVKRLLAYSSIAHAGYMLMGVVVLDFAGSTAVMIYLVIYLFMNLGAFTVVQTVADTYGSEELSAYRGLGYRSPFLAVSLGVFLFSLAGIPPLAGFVGKFFLFASLINNGGFWYVLLAVIGILNSLLALFYYAIILREMFLRQAEAAASNPLKISKINSGLIAVMGVMVFVLGIYWEPLLKAANKAAAVLGL